MSETGCNMPISRDLIALCDGYTPADLRPHTGTVGEKSHYALRDEIHQWLDARHVSYDLYLKTRNEGRFWYEYDWTVWISDPKVGMMFKLTFS